MPNSGMFGGKVGKCRAGYRVLFSQAFGCERGKRGMPCPNSIVRTHDKPGTARS